MSADFMAAAAGVMAAVAKVAKPARKHVQARPQAPAQWCDIAVARATSSGGPRTAVITPKGRSHPAYTVAASRAAKSARLLSPDNTAAALTSTCSCVGNPCKAQVTPHQVQQVRLWLAQANTEQDATGKLALWMQHSCFHADGGLDGYVMPDIEPTRTPFSQRRGEPEKRAAPIRLCRRGLVSILGISETKFRRARTVAIQLRVSAAVSGVPATMPALIHGNTDQRYRTKAEKALVCRSFWDIYYKMICNVISAETRSVPSGQVKKQVYQDVFKPWYASALAANTFPVDYPAAPPGLTTFTRLSKHVDFSDVKKRAKHYHTRCQRCATLQTMRLKAFIQNSPERLEYIAQTQAHYNDVLAFRELEHVLYQHARTNPHDFVTISCDDTESLRLPHFTNRERKDAAGIYRYDLTPWLFENSATGDLGYVLSPKVNHKKGGNRWCTTMYCLLRAMKSGSSPAASARTLYLIGDNYSEQKCNTDLHFGTQLVAEQWFDEVLFFYGQVGHTHTSIDARHKIFNQDVKRGNIGTLGELPALVSQKFTVRRPDLYLMDLQLDWDSIYTNSMERLSGFTNSGGDAATANAFRIARQDSSYGGKVGLWWKPTANLSTPWLGNRGTADSEPFILMRHRTVRVPQVLPVCEPMPEKQKKSLFGKAMVKCLNEEQMPGVMDWLKTCVNTQTFPLVSDIEPGHVPGRFGRLVEVGVRPNIGRFRLIDRAWLGGIVGDDDENIGNGAGLDHSHASRHEVFWQLPAGTVKAMNDRRRAQTASSYTVELANVRYNRSAAAVSADAPASAEAQMVLPVELQPIGVDAPPADAPPNALPKGKARGVKRKASAKVAKNPKPKRAAKNPKPKRAGAKKARNKPAPKPKAAPKPKPAPKRKPMTARARVQHQPGDDIEARALSASAPRVGSARLRHAPHPDYTDGPEDDIGSINSDMSDFGEDVQYERSNIVACVSDSESDFQLSDDHDDDDDDDNSDSGTDTVDEEELEPPSIAHMPLPAKRGRAKPIRLKVSGAGPRVQAPRPAAARAPKPAKQTTAPVQDARVSNLDTSEEGLWVLDDTHEGGFVVSTAEYKNGELGLSFSAVIGTSDPDDDEGSLQTRTVPTASRLNLAHPNCLAGTWRVSNSDKGPVHTTPGASIITRFTRFRRDGRLHQAVTDWIKQTETYKNMVQQATVVNRNQPQSSRGRQGGGDSSDDDVPLNQLKVRNRQRDDV